MTARYLVKWYSKITSSTGYLGGGSCASLEEAVQICQDADGDPDYRHYIQEQRRPGQIEREFWPDDSPFTGGA